jgi:hypothetical protein
VKSDCLESAVVSVLVSVLVNTGAAVYEGRLSGDDAAYLGELAVFDMRPNQGFCKFVALAAAAPYVQLLADVFHGFGTVIERPANRFVGDVMAYANDHGASPLVWARRLLDDYPQAKSC